MGSSLPELTPERLSEIKILLVVAGILIAFIASPFVLSWCLERLNAWLERKNRIMRSAYQLWCHRCRRGTDWNEQRTKCLECQD